VAEGDRDEGIFARVHRWISVPVVELERDARELYAVTAYTCFIGLLSYLSYIPLFIAIGAEFIALVNVAITILFAVALNSVRRGYLFRGMSLASTLVAAHAWLTVLTLGPDAGFQLHVILALELGLLFTYVPAGLRILYSLVFMTAYLGLITVSDFTTPPLQLTPGWERVLRLSNSTIFVGITTAIAVIYAWSVRSNRDTLDTTLHELEERNALLRDAQHELAGAKTAAEEASRAKSMFLANMSHELRTPLNAIIGYSEMIEEEAEDDGNEDLAQSVNRIRGAGRHLLSVINDILDLSKIEAGKMEVEELEFVVADVLDEVLETSRTLASEKDNELVLKVEGELGVMRSDPTKLRQILLNLLSNACKFTEKGSVSLLASPETRDEQPGVCFAVRDTGIGIASEKVERIFGEFSQADTSTTRRFGGTGLGLTITHTFCRMLGGVIEVSSELGEGSEFRVWLPRASAIAEGPSAP
jgi:signal transduction histidine kinase